MKKLNNISLLSIIVSLAFLIHSVVVFNPLLVVAWGLFLLKDVIDVAAEIKANRNGG
tara:strand:+ start:11695 stop:11865 length:171 start_codon:yes stop_codon:yes gene_type:complete